MLTDRRAEILGLVVDEYVQRAIPVSSRVLADRHGLGVSPATIRNELAMLERDGYITHPHTSAGRVPSDRGYRLYVEALMAEQPVAVEEQRTIEHQFHQTPSDVAEWLRLAAVILASAVGNVAVVTRPRSQLARLRQVQIVHLHAEAALVVAVMEDGRVQERMLALTRPATQEQLARLAQHLNARCGGLAAAEVRALEGAGADPDEERLLATLADLIEAHAASGELYVEGVRVTLEQPEFASAARMLDAVQHLEEYQVRRALPTPVEIGQGSTRILIGAEHANVWWQDWTVVAATYGDAGGRTGTIAVLGPTRMRYGHTIPRVQYVASLMTSLLASVSR